MSGGPAIPGMPGMDGGCFGGGKGIGDMLSGLGQKALGSLVDKAFGKITAIKDTDPAALAIGKHLAKKFEDQIKKAIKDPAALQKRFDELFKGAKSTAWVPIGRADLLDLPNMVYVGGLPATRRADIATSVQPPDTGPFIQGNPKVILNGMPAAGEIHIAIGENGTVMTPFDLALTVLMGGDTETDMSLVPKQQPGNATASSSVNSGPGGSAGEGNNNSTSMDPEKMGQAGADKGRELIDGHGGDKYEARNEVIEARREHYDRELAALIAERDGLSPQEQEDLYNRLHQDQAYRNSEVAQLSTDERDALHDPVLTNADRYIEMRIQIEQCGTVIAEIKAETYDYEKGRRGTADATDNDGRSSSPLGIGQSTADEEARRDALDEGGSYVPPDLSDCLAQSVQDLAHIPGL